MQGKVSSYTLSRSSPERILVRSNPFGRTWTLNVDGYQAYTFEAGSWKGNRIVVERELKRIPSLLIRVPVKELSVLNGKVLSIRMDSQKGEKISGFDPYPIEMLYWSH